MYERGDDDDQRDQRPQQVRHESWPRPRWVLNGNTKGAPGSTRGKGEGVGREGGIGVTCSRRR